MTTSVCQFLSRKLAPVALLTALVSLVACGGDDPPTTNIGARCADAVACTTGRCEVSGSFPGGLCTQTCSKSSECPAGFVCISNQGGICMQTCSKESDCASYGSAWTCGEESEQGSSSGKPLVCAGR